MIFPANLLNLNQGPCLCTKILELLNKREQQACLFEHVYPPTQDLPGSLILYPSSWSVERPALPWSGYSRLQGHEFLPVHLGEPGGGVFQDLRPILFSSLVPKSLRGRAAPGGRQAVHVQPCPHCTWPEVDPSTLGPWTQSQKRGSLWGRGLGSSLISAIPAPGKLLISLLSFIHSFNIYLLPGTVLGTEYMVVNKTDLVITVLMMNWYRCRRIQI